MNPDTLLAEALVDLLKASPAVTALVGQRLYPVAPRLPTTPCLAVTRIESRPFGEGEGLEQALTLTAVSRFGGPEEARAVVAAVRTALHEARPVLTGRKLVTLRVTYADVFRAADREQSLGIVRVRAVTEAG